MSSQNGYPGPNAARPAVRPANAPGARQQPSWVHPQAQAGQPGQPNGWPQQPGPAAYQGGVAQQPYGAQVPQQQPAYGQWSEQQQAGPVASGAQADPYAPQFEPYAAPARPNYPQSPAPPQPPRGPAGQPAPQWPGRADPRGFDVGSYAAPAYAAPQAMPQQTYGGGYGEQTYQEAGLSASDWAGPQGSFGHDPYQQSQDGAEFGFAQADGGEVESAYGEDEAEYEEEDAPRGRRPLMIAFALIGAILVGGGMAYGYKKLAGGDSQGDPPVIKSAEFPSKTKPADAGGKQFPYSDTKILGRLGDGTSSASAAESDGSAPAASPDSSSNSSASSSTDEGGTRKVATLVVGRDGTIQPPPTPASQSSSDVSVPGTALVDVFGQHGGSAPPPPAAPVRDEAPPKPKAKSLASADMASPAKKTTPAAIAKVNSAGALKTTTGSIDDSADAPSPPPKKKLKKVAKAETTETDAVADASGPPVPSAAAGSAISGGYVAVLASVPSSASSRIDALKRFADMQQKYGSALAGKTPDVASANLGAKGSYDRLVVGPPGSRAEASNICAGLKAQGYNDCWVTSY